MAKPRVLRHEVIQPQDQSIKLIPLTQGQSAIVDAADYDWLNQWNWTADWNKTTRSFYVMRKDSNNKKIYMHRALFNSEPKEVDHHNRNTLDNRRLNLRPCNNIQNKMNFSKKSTNTSGYKGVYWSKDRNKWIANGSVKGRTVYLGAYDSPELAHAAYLDFAKSIHGEFASSG